MNVTSAVLRRRTIGRAALALVVGLLLATNARAERLRIGVTLLPYYSFVTNVVGDHADVMPLITTGSNGHGYQPQPGDIKRAMDLDVLVVNGIGHDEWAFDILEAAQVTDKVTVIYANEGVALFPVAGTAPDEKIVNPHTFISVSSTIPQVYNIAGALAALDPENAKAYRANARSYTTRLRKLKAQYMEKLADLPELSFQCATVHGGYDYLLQEFGLEVAAVIEPRHGSKPTATELRSTIDELQQLEVDVIFAERDYPDKYVATVQEATGIPVRHLSHLTAGDYTPEAFEKDLEENLGTVVDALLTVHKDGTP